MTVDQLAYVNGFRKAGQISSSTKPTEEPLGLKVVTSPLLPEGWVGLKNNRGAALIDPDGNIHWVPFMGGYE